jgi:ubiquinone/menaquinone biosynthesis C-methylase UbiE
VNTSHEKNPTTRFSDRVDLYIRYRPTYPAELIELLSFKAQLTTSSVVADIGSGTGILSELFLKNGNPVLAVEPNNEMRQASEHLLRAYPNFKSINGAAESTGIAAATVDLVTAGQSFHWFNQTAARQEFQRILKAQGYAVIVFNTRKTDGSRFLAAYEDLLCAYCPEYRQVRHNNIDEHMLESFFGSYDKVVLPNHQDFDYEGLLGRLLSSSYAPLAGQSGYEPMVNELQRIFVDNEASGIVTFDYDTEVYFGRLT